MTSLIDAGGAFRAMNRVANTVGLTLRQEIDCTQPYTDLKAKVVTVPALSAYTSEDKYLLWLAYGYHEVGHHAPEVADMLDYMESHSISMGTLFGRLGNIIEDIRNERNGHGYYPGRDKALAFCQAYHAKDGASQLAKNEEAFGPDMQLFTEILGLAYHYRGNTFQPGVALPSMEYGKQVDSTRWHFLLPELDKMETAEDVWDIVRKILDESEEHSAEEEEEKAKQPSGGEETDEGKGEETDEDSDGSVSYEDLLAHSHEEGEYTGTSDKRIQIVYDHTKRNDWIPHPRNNIERVTPAKSVQTEMQAMYDMGSKLGGEVKRLFQARSQTLNTYRHKSGKLSKRDLYRVPQGDNDVFKRKQHRLDTKGTAVFLLTDASGSMCGSPYDATGASAALMAEALQVINVPLMIGSFTETGSELVSFIMKEWTAITTPDELMRKYTAKQHALHMNADGDSVMWAYGELMKRKEERKILIVLSDGEPSAARKGDAYTHLKNVIPYVSRDVECYGIGIMSDAVSHFYPEYTVLKDTTQLQQCLLNTIKLKIIGA